LLVRLPEENDFPVTLSHHSKGKRDREEFLRSKNTRDQIFGGKKGWRENKQIPGVLNQNQSKK
jgi:hypothetical protein